MILLSRAEVEALPSGYHETIKGKTVLHMDCGENLTEHRDFEFGDRRGRTSRIIRCKNCNRLVLKYAKEMCRNCYSLNYRSVQSKLHIVKVSTLPYPTNLISQILDPWNDEVSSLEAPVYTTDQINGLNQVLLTLKPRTLNILMQYYCSHQTMAQIARQFKLSRERIRQIITTSIVKMHRSDSIDYVVEGLTAATAKRQALARKHPSLDADPNSIRVLKLTTRGVNCLLNAGIISITDLENFRIDDLQTAELRQPKTS